MLEGTEWKSRQSGSEGSTMTREHEVGVRHPSIEGEDIDNGITCLIDLANSVNHSLHTHTKTEPLDRWFLACLFQKQKMASKPAVTVPGFEDVTMMSMACFEDLKVWCPQPENMEIGMCLGARGMLDVVVMTR